MQAVILAGGLGTRLGSLTNSVPKPMVPVGGVPYLEHQIALLSRQGICEIVVLTGYLGEQIESYFGEGARWGVSLRYSRESAPLGTGGALRKALPLLKDIFLVIYGDSYLPIEYAAPLEQLAASDCEGLLVVCDNSHGDTGVRNNILLDEHRRHVLRYDKNGGPDLDYIEAGVLAFRRTVIERIALDGAFALETAVFPPLAARRKLLACVTPQRFYDLGTPDRLEAIRKVFLK